MSLEMGRGLNSIASYIEGSDSGLSDAFTRARMYHGVKPSIGYKERAPQAIQIEIPLPGDWQERISKVEGSFHYKLQGKQIYADLPGSHAQTKNSGIWYLLNSVRAASELLTGIGGVQQQYIPVASLKDNRLFVNKETTSPIKEIQDDLIARMQSN